METLLTVVEVVVVGHCADCSDVAGIAEGHGCDCDGCMEQFEAGTAIENSGDLGGVAAYVDANSTFCLTTGTF